MSKDLVYRVLKTEEEENQYRKYCHYCFPAHVKGNNYKKFYWPHPKLKREWMRGLFLKDNKTLLGGDHLIPMDVKFGGAKLKAIGLAGLAVPSQYREKKVAMVMIQNMFGEGFKTGKDIAIGFPFKFSFYQRIEASLIEEMKLMKFRPEDVVRARTSYKLREVEDNFDDIKSIYNEKVKEIDYICIRSDFEWTKKLEDSFKFIVYDKEKKARGYVLVKFIERKNESDLHRSVRTILKGKMLNKCLFIDEVFWLDPEAKQEIFNFFYTHRDQRDTIIGYFPMWENIMDYLSNFHFVWEIKRAKMMMKILNAKSVLSKIPYPKSLGDFVMTFDIKDNFLKWNSGIITIERKDDKVKVKIDKKTKENENSWDAQANMVHFQQVVAGFMSWERLLVRKLVKVKKEKLEFLEKAFPKKKQFFNESY